MSWNVSLFFTWPHDRCLVGWSYLPPDDKENYHTFELFFTIVSLQINWD
jgi:hypothetical protein